MSIVSLVFLLSEVGNGNNCVNVFLLEHNLYLFVRTTFPVTQKM